MRIWTVARRELKSLVRPAHWIRAAGGLPCDQWISLLPSGLSHSSGQPQAHAGCAPLALPLLRARGHHAIAGRGHPRWPARGGTVPTPERAGAAAGQIHRLGVVPLDCSCPHRMHSAGALTGCGHALGHCYRPVCWGRSLWLQALPPSGPGPRARAGVRSPRSCWPWY